MNDNKTDVRISTDVTLAVNVIKSAILQSQSRAVRMISGTQLSLYFGIGLYVSANSRKGTWGTGAIKFISEQLRRELPGLRGFSEESIKKMRTFSEFWSQYLNRSPMATEMDLDKLQEDIECDVSEGVIESVNSNLEGVTDAVKEESVMKHIKVVAAIICKDGKILATQRGYGEWKGWWEFPGGKMEADEAPEDALRREILEELSAPIDIDRFLCTMEYDYPKFHLTMHCYLCTLASDSWTLNEHEAALWLSRDELDTVKWLPADIEVIDILRSAVADKEE